MQEGSRRFFKVTMSPLNAVLRLYVTIVDVRYWEWFIVYADDLLKWLELFGWVVNQESFGMIVISKNWLVCSLIIRAYES